MSVFLKKISKGGLNKTSQERKCPEILPTRPPSPALDDLTPDEIRIINDVVKRQVEFDQEEGERIRKLERELQTYELLVKQHASTKSKLKQVDLRLCRLCFKTKFADGIGRVCSDCHRRVCNSCGSFSKSKWDSKKKKYVKGRWQCNMCQRRRDLKCTSGEWFHGACARPLLDEESFQRKISLTHMMFTASDVEDQGDSRTSPKYETANRSDSDLLSTMEEPRPRSWSAARRRAILQIHRESSREEEDWEVNREKFQQERQRCRQQRQQMQKARRLSRTRESPSECESIGLRLADHMLTDTCATPNHALTKQLSNRSGGQRSSSDSMFMDSDCRKSFKISNESGIFLKEERRNMLKDKFRPSEDITAAMKFSETDYDSPQQSKSVPADFGCEVDQRGGGQTAKRRTTVHRVSSLKKSLRRPATLSYSASDSHRFSASHGLGRSLVNRSQGSSILSSDGSVFFSSLEHREGRGSFRRDSPDSGRYRQLNRRSGSSFCSSERSVGSLASEDEMPEVRRTRAGSTKQHRHRKQAVNVRPPSGIIQCGNSPECKEVLPNSPPCEKGDFSIPRAQLQRTPSIRISPSSSPTFKANSGSSRLQTYVPSTYERYSSSSQQLETGKGGESSTNSLAGLYTVDTSTRCSPIKGPDTSSLLLQSANRPCQLSFADPQEYSAAQTFQLEYSRLNKGDVYPVRQVNDECRNVLVPGPPYSETDVCLSPRPLPKRLAELSPRVHERNNPNWGITRSNSAPQSEKGLLEAKAKALMSRTRKSDEYHHGTESIAALRHFHQRKGQETNTDKIEQQMVTLGSSHIHPFISRENTPTVKPNVETKFKFPAGPNTSVSRLYHISIERDKTDASVRTAGLGMRVVGGVPGNNGRLCAMVTAVITGSAADVKGRIKPGDIIVEWNNNTLEDATFEMVKEITSGNDDVVDIILLRKDDGLPTPPTSGHSEVTNKALNTMGLKACHAVKRKRMLPKTPTELRYTQVTIKGNVELQMWFSQEAATLAITILKIEGLGNRDNQPDNPPSPLIKLRLLHTNGKMMMLKSHKTSTIANCTNPVWNETFLYEEITQELTANLALEVRVWDVLPGTELYFLGETIVLLTEANLDDLPASYPLKNSHCSAPHTPSTYLSPLNAGDTNQSLCSLPDLPAMPAYDRVMQLLFQRQALPSLEPYSRWTEQYGHSSETSLQESAASPNELRKNDNWRKSMITNRRNIEGNDEEMQNQELTRAKGKANSELTHKKGFKKTIHKAMQKYCFNRFKGADAGYMADSDSSPLISRAKRPGSLKIESSTAITSSDRWKTRRSTCDIGTITATSTSKLVTTQPRKISQISADLNTDTDGETGDIFLAGNPDRLPPEGDDVTSLLGPGQVPPRPSAEKQILGDIQLGFMVSKGQLELDIYCAKGLSLGATFQAPDTYVKASLVQSNKKLQRRKTKVVKGSTEPAYRQKVRFSASNAYGRFMVISIKEKAGGFEKNHCLGEVAVKLDSLDLSKHTEDWYKIFQEASTDLESDDSFIFF